MAEPTKYKPGSLYESWRKFADEKEAAYKKFEQEEWDKNGAEWTKQGYIRKTDTNNSWGSTWSKNPVVTPPAEEKEVKEVKEPVEKKQESVTPPPVETPKFASYEDVMKQRWARQSHYGANVGWVDENGMKITNAKEHQGKKYQTFVTTGLYGDHNDLTYAYDPETGNVRRLHENWFGNIGSGWSDANATGSVNNGGWGSLAEMLANYGINFKKQGGTMNKVKYFAGGGQAQQAQQAQQGNLQQQVTALVQAAMAGDQQATQQVNQIMEAAKSGDQQAAQIAQLIQQVVQQMQGQATMNKWGSKLQYVRSLKYAKGGKHTCPACMSKGGSTDENVKVAKKDVDAKTYQKQSFAKKTELDEHRLATETSSNKNGSYNISHKPSAKDSTEIKRHTMSEDMNKVYPKVKSKACGGSAPKAKKHYFGGWL